MDENLNESSLPNPDKSPIISGKIEKAPAEEREGITLGQIWFMVKKHFVAIIIMAFIGLAAGILYDRVIKKPSYTATTQLMIVNTDAEDNSTINNISEAKNKCMIAYGYMTSDEVVNALAKKLVDDGYDDYLNKDDKGNKIADSYNLTNVKKLYTVEIPTVTSNTTSIFLTVTSSAKEEQLAINVANYVPAVTIELCNTKGTNGYAYLKNSMTSLGNVTTATDTSTSTIMLALVGIAGGVVLGCAYAVVRELIDSKVGSRYDIEQITGYKVIGMVPKYDAYVITNDDGSNKEEGGNKNA